MREEAADLPSTVYKKDNGAAFCFTAFVPDADADLPYLCF